jgi:hypothetical protein
MNSSTAAKCDKHLDLNEYMTNGRSKIPEYRALRLPSKWQNGGSGYFFPSRDTSYANATALHMVLTGGKRNRPSFFDVRLDSLTYLLPRV